MNSVIDMAKEWQNRPLKEFYLFLFVDWLYVNIRKNSDMKNSAVYVILRCDIYRIKDVLGIWTDDFEGKHYWMQIFDELKDRDFEDVFLSS